MNRPAGWDDAMRVMTIVKTTLSDRATEVYLDIDESVRGVTGVLFDAFVFQIGLEQPRGNLAAGIQLAGGRLVTAPFGRRFTLNSDDASIRGVLGQMEEWARLRLPDKYLERWGSSTKYAEPAEEQDAIEYDYFAQVTFRNGVRVPVRVFRTAGGRDEIYSANKREWVPDEAAILQEDRLGARDHEIWPVTRLQAGQVILMIESGTYRPLEIPGLLD